MTEFSKVILGKSLQDLQYKDVADFFINEHGESNTIEFKAFSATHGNFKENIKGVIRAVCGMLNSDGGLVIWGAPLGVADPVTKEKKFIGALAPVPEYKEKDWLINKISDSISPLPTGIRVAVLQQGANENLYVIEVESSPYKPHQFDNTYFVRLDGQTKPAPHYFIEALFRRISYPNIEGYVKIDRAGLLTGQSLYYMDITCFMFNFTQMQNEEDITVRLMTDPGYFDDTSEFTNNSKNYEISKLHFGLVNTHRARILFDPYQLDAKGKKIRFIMTYTGKHSPAKSSIYTIDFARVDLGNAANTGQMLVQMEENVLFSERQERLGTTRESTLQASLGRTPDKF
ncbi:Putative DNA-binding domain-containing protein [Pedobacter terrae]|uniref:Putative DNA-binding domain-containing protein n=1 Tax=Pedobacter terrae TaxID=405671 RepID=A0A1G7Q5T4_9SPHI|nr:ATP-binding protein [Pedobacter terrae]SDF93833.1 Putative DNA-binding domain-containing protein [Pedobacter terrae]